MADQATDPFALFPTSIFPHLRTLPSTLTVARLTEVARRIAEAQMAFGQALLQANAVWVESWFDSPARPDEASPSVAARMPESAGV